MVYTICMAIQQTIGQGCVRCSVSMYIEYWTCVRYLGFVYRHWILIHRRRVWLGDTYHIVHVCFMQAIEEPPLRMSRD